MKLNIFFSGVAINFYLEEALHSLDHLRAVDVRPGLANHYFIEG